jgi:hypothetical protein
MVPRVRVRVQACFRRFVWIWATHLPPTFLPESRCVKAKAMVAYSLSVNENVVPTGGLRLLIWASLSPGRHLLWDWVALVTVGGVGLTTGGIGAAAVVNVWSAP